MDKYIMFFLNKIQLLFFLACSLGNRKPCRDRNAFFILPPGHIISEMGNTSVIIVLGILALASVLGWWVVNTRSDLAGESGKNASSELNDALYKRVVAYSVNRMGKEEWKDPQATGGTQRVWDATKDVNDMYESAWKSIFMKKNKLSEDYYQKHIKVLDTGISTDQSFLLSIGMRSDAVKTRGREYYNVLYRASIDWAEFSNIDYFMIRENSSMEYVPTEAVEEYAYIPEEVEKYPLKRSRISSLLPAEKLEKTFYDAARGLRDLHPPMTQRIDPQYVYLTETGEIALYGSGCADYEKNAGVEGYYNLNTGKGSYSRGYCWKT